MKGINALSVLAEASECFARSKTKVTGHTSPALLEKHSGHTPICFSCSVTMGPKMCITCGLCGSGSMVPERRICRWCDSMLCAPCVDVHTYQIAAHGMTCCQLWSHENN
eukprot:1952960-Karenia_brevis.AAC.2